MAGCVLLAPEVESAETGEETDGAPWASSKTVWPCVTGDESGEDSGRSPGMTASSRAGEISGLVDESTSLGEPRATPTRGGRIKVGICGAGGRARKACAAGRACARNIGTAACEEGRTSLALRGGAERGLRMGRGADSYAGDCNAELLVRSMPTLAGEPARIIGKGREQLRC
jgi:hypothetical protein